MDRWSRGFWVRLHRWVGLVLASFLSLAGATGAVLVWYPELDAWVARDLHRPTSGATGSLDVFALRERLRLLYPDARINHLPLRQEPGKTVTFYLEPAHQGAAKEALPNDEVFVDPANATVVGERRWGDIAQGFEKNLLPFLYRLHYQLALGTVGTYLFGIVSLLWTLDCFVGAYLTLPVAGRRASRHAGADTAGRGWWARWRTAWRVRWHSGGHRLNFDLHRAGGLWLWAMLFVLAWSGVAFNLNKEVYHPVMKTFLTMDDREDAIRLLEPAQAEPGLPWREAHRLARQHMASEATRLGFAVLQEDSLSYDPAKALYRYDVRSSADIRDRAGQTRLYLDANDGSLRFTSLPTGQFAGTTATTWLTSLHMAQLWSWPFRFFMTGVGALVVMLSVTGVVIWLRKHRATRLRTSQARR